ncbi:hypothetical protein DPMN_075337 [Dreissena polymorpha]|uniref:Uncharacterized protein n=1 Tax=Dreissena polymorpha TaxID=45954 RepID=A0A9D3YKW6_DREPO|nr:hypothetical protein DPMN_075337 [Dreissena polymorpha]
MMSLQSIQTHTADGITSKKPVFPRTWTVNHVNKHLGTVIEPNGIDIAHRPGKFKPNINRRVIVRFVRRETKIYIMRKATLVKGSGIFVKEDLTKLNVEVLASLRLKRRSVVERSWSFEGKICALFKGNQQTTHIKYSEYKLWLEKPWPKKSYSESVETPVNTENIVRAQKS